jgi:GNAT superfamily N-acetyltransferase
MIPQLTIRPIIHETDRLPLVELARRLPEWFNDEAVEEMDDDLHDDPGFVAEVAGHPVGFLTYFAPASLPAHKRFELTWIAVGCPHHGQGVGLALLNVLLSHIEATEGPESEILVWTLPEQVDNKPYVLTRKFYKKHGFEDFTLDTENIVQWGFPRLFLLKKLGGA